jgi:hypothetical protein
MGILTALAFTPVVVIGVTVGSPFILSFIGLGAAGPVAGGLFAATQATAATGIAAGSWMAVAQAVAMAAVSPTP